MTFLQVNAVVGVGGSVRYLSSRPRRSVRGKVGGLIWAWSGRMPTGRRWTGSIFVASSSSVSEFLSILSSRRVPTPLLSLEMISCTRNRLSGIRATPPMP